MSELTPEIIRNKIDKLITDSGLNYRVVSLMMGKSEAYMQQYIKLRSPLRLKEVDRKKLAKILKVPENELTDLPSMAREEILDILNEDILTLIISKLESWLEENEGYLPPNDKAKLITLIYKKIINTPDENKTAKIIDFIEVYESVKKAN